MVRKQQLEAWRTHTPPPYLGVRGLQEKKEPPYKWAADKVSSVKTRFVSKKEKGMLRE